MRKTPGCFPTAQQELLLRAALLDGADAVDAWREWSLSIDFDRLDYGSERLLPLLCKNLKANGVADESMRRFESARRQTFKDNQLLFFKSLDVLCAIKNAGIEIMLLKGAALALLHYKEIGLRPMLDLDILVPNNRASEAIEILSKLGWKPLFKAPHSQGFKGNDGGEIDLHWHTLLELSADGADDEFWNGAVKASIHDVQLIAPNPTDLLFQICVHGSKWDPIPPLRWIADATIILKSGNEIDWDRLLQHARKHRLTLPLKESLQYLKELLNAPIPADLLLRLEAVPVTVSERLDFASRTMPHSERGPFLTLWAYYGEYQHWARSHGATNQIMGFPRFLKHLWGIDNVWQVPHLTVQGFARRSFKRAKNTRLSMPHSAEIGE